MEFSIPINPEEILPAGNGAFTVEQEMTFESDVNSADDLIDGAQSSTRAL